MPLLLKQKVAHRKRRSLRLPYIFIYTLLMVIQTDSKLETASVV
jgi:hypothetical protein